MDRMFRSRIAKLAVFVLILFGLYTFLYPSSADKLSALQQPITSASSSSSSSSSSSTPYVAHKSLAIIGAGSAGASTAYYAHDFAAEKLLNVNITIYERNDYIGGRSTTVQAYDDPAEPVELGASIFVRVNYNLYDTARRFKLPISDDGRGTTDGSDELGIWNGEKFVFIQSTGSYWELAKMFWKYGLAPLKVKRLIDGTIAKFLKMYEAPVFPWGSLTQVVHDLDLTTTTSVDGRTFLKDQGIWPGFSEEIVQAATRVNYAANLGYIHGLETMVSMASDAMAIEGGNWKIFEAMINHSRATLHLSTPVTEVFRNDNKTWTAISSSPNGATQSAVYDAVVIAGPYQFFNLTASRITPPKVIEYVRLHVTLFASPRRLDPKYFGYTDKVNVPDMILTTLPDPPETDNSAGLSGFYSVSLLRTTLRAHEASGKIREEFIYKIFSKVEWSDEKIYALLGLAKSVGEEKEAISWKYRKIWESYPVEYPRAVFDEQRLDFGLWYTGGMESFISTMETNSLSGKNVAANMVDGWVEEEKKKVDKMKGQL